MKRFSATVQTGYSLHSWPDSPPARLGGPGGDLSDRESDVLRLIAMGLTNVEIAEQIYVSVRTVETHRAHIQQKLNTKSRAELVRFALDTGLLNNDSSPG